MGALGTTETTLPRRHHLCQVAYLAVVRIQRQRGFRFFYVRYAPGLIKEGTRLLHCLALIFIRKDFNILRSFNKVS